MIRRTPRQLAISFCILSVLVLTSIAILFLKTAGLVPPLVADGLILVLSVAKAKYIIDDFMGFRERRGALGAALLMWPILFALAAFCRVVVKGALSF